MARPKLVRHRHGAKRYTTKQLAESLTLRMSASAPAEGSTWETFTIGVRDVATEDGYDVTFDRAEAEHVVEFLLRHLNEVVRKV